MISNRGVFWVSLYLGVGAYFGMAILAIWLYRIGVSDDPSRDFVMVGGEGSELRNWHVQLIFWGHYLVFPPIIRKMRPNESLLPFTLIFPVLLIIYLGVKLQERSLFLGLVNIALFFVAGTILSNVYQLFQKGYRYITIKIKDEMIKDKFKELNTLQGKIAFTIFTTISILFTGFVLAIAGFFAFIVLISPGWITWNANEGAPS